MEPLSELKRAGLKITSPRLKILELFDQGGRKHLCAEEIFHAFLAQDIRIGQSTIYRTLMQLERAGVLRKSPLSELRHYYEIDDGQHHDHFVCLQCGKVTEFSDALIEQHQLKIAERLGFRLTAHTLAIYCRCTRKDCPALSAPS